MPQMSPLSWTVIFIMLIVFMTMLLNSINGMNSMVKPKLVIKKKENIMKW